MHQAYGVLGHPLGHSLSPFLHGHAFKRYGMDRCYYKWDVKPDDLPDFMRALRLLPLSGVSVTIPFKERVMPFLDEISREAREIGAVNTIYFQEERLWGTNTDYLGFMSPLMGMNLESALVLGAGGAARSVLYGLKKLEIGKIFICNRSQSRALELADEFHVQAVDWELRLDVAADLLVNTTPLGTRGDKQEMNPLDSDDLPFRAVYDLVYNPLETRLLKKAEGLGIRTVSGLSMFVHQALEQFRIWTGQAFDPLWAEDLLRGKLSDDF